MTDRPDEEVVREQLHDEKQRVEEAAAAENNSAAAAPQPTADSRQPTDADKASEYLELAQRTQADFENFRKRAVKDMAAAGARAKAGLIRGLLPVVDNLERAIAAVSDEGAAQGLNLGYAELERVLSRNGGLAGE